MATINTIQDLLRLLDENPEWVDALRARLLTQELLELPERLSQFEATVERFIESTNKRFDTLEAGQARLEATVERFVESTNRRFDVNEVQHARFEAEMKALRRDSAILRGGHGLTTAIRQAPIIARSMGFRRTRTLDGDNLWDMTDESDTSDIHANVLNSFRRADLVMEATDSDGESCYIAVEVSYTVHQSDISRASRNSRFLTRFTGRPAFAAVAGEHVHNDVQDLIDSGAIFWHQLTPQELEVE